MHLGLVLAELVAIAPTSLMIASRVKPPAEAPDLNLGSLMNAGPGAPVPQLPLAQWEVTTAHIFTTSGYTRYRYRTRISGEPAVHPSVKNTSIDRWPTPLASIDGGSITVADETPKPPWSTAQN